MLGLIVPPQLQSLTNQHGQNNSNALNSTLAQLGINPNDIQAPQFENLTYDSSTGLATLSLNLTNPLTGQSLDISNFSVTVTSSNGTQPFTMSLPQPIEIAPDQTGIMSISLSVSNPQELQSIINSNQTMSNLQFSNLYVNVNGVTLQIGNLNQLSQGSNSNGNNNNNGNNNGNNNIGNNNVNSNNGNNNVINNNGNIGVLGR